MLMTPADYEYLVGEYFRKLGYHVTVTPASNDYGIDIIATKENEKIAIQAKMYGGTIRKVNRQTIFELYGAAAYADCDRAMLATNGRVLDDARRVADKLGIEILSIGSVSDSQEAEADLDSPSVEKGETCSRHNRQPESTTVTAANPSGETFEYLWKTYIMPLAGKTLYLPSGKSNLIKQVDWSGVQRITSNDRQQDIDIKIFRYAVNKIFTTGSITRDDINQQYTGRASSGIMLILSQIPIFSFECSRSGQRLSLKSEALGRCDSK